MVLELAIAFAVAIQVRPERRKAELVKRPGDRHDVRFLHVARIAVKNDRDRALFAHLFRQVQLRVQPDAVVLNVHPLPSFLLCNSARGLPAARVHFRKKALAGCTG